MEPRACVDHCSPAAVGLGAVVGRSAGDRNLQRPRIPLTITKYLTRPLLLVRVKHSEPYHHQRRPKKLPTSMMRDAAQTTVPPCSLHRLGPTLRRRIYLHTGVARFDGHPYTYYLDGRKESRSCRTDFDPPPPRSFAGLLLSCRTLYAETSALLYSANRFVILYSRQRSLAPLRSLLPVSLASIATLKIVLNESSCHHPVDSCDYPPWCCYDGPEYDGCTQQDDCVQHDGNLHNQPLVTSNPVSVPGSTSTTSPIPAVQAMLLEWHSTAAYVSSLITTRQLTLSLVCDLDPRCDNVLEAAQSIIAPLAHFPSLKDCHIRLCNTPNSSLQQVAQEGVLQARPEASPLCIGPAKTSSSSLTTLPAELRLRILEYTDLITPWGEVTWGRNSRSHGYQIARPPCTMAGEDRCPPYILTGCLLSRCRCYLCPRPGPGLEHGCFCCHRHAASSSGCRCWAPPTGLFLICRALHRDAEFVFFSGNRFIVHDFDPTQPWALGGGEPVFEPGPDPGSDISPEGAARAARACPYPEKRFAASEFLRDVVPARCLPHLRFLELVFPPYDPLPQNDHPAVLDWCATLDWVRDKIKAPALAIRFVMAEVYSQAVGPRHEALTKEAGREILNGYMRVIHPVKPLVRDDGLAGFYVQAAYPWRWTDKTRRRIRRYGGGWLAEAE